MLMQIFVQKKDATARGGSRQNIVPKIKRALADCYVKEEALQYNSKKGIWEAQKAAALDS